jgi:hypothetical protein
VIRRAAVLLGVPVLLAAGVALPLGMWRGSHHWVFAAIAVGLVVSPGLVTLFLSERLRAGSAAGQVAALVLGTVVRLVVGFGGAVLVFVLSKPRFHEDAIAYWMWILGIYLVALAIETALLARARPPVSVTTKVQAGVD